MMPALVVMGLRCLVNAARCMRLHCYVTGPLCLAAALYVVLSAFGLVVLRLRLFLIVVLGLSCVAQRAEIPLGK